MFNTKVLRNHSAIWRNYFGKQKTILRRNLSLCTIPLNDYKIKTKEKIVRRFYCTNISKTFSQSELFLPELSSIFKKFVGLFQYNDISCPAGFHVLQKQVQKDVAKIMQECISSDRSRKMVEVFDDLSNTLCKLADMAEFVRLAHPSEDFRRSAEEVGTSIISIVESLNTNTEIYSALKRVLNEGDVIEMDEIDKHVSDLFIFDFEQSGIHLSEVERVRVNELNETILLSGHKFHESTNIPRQIETRFVPLFIRQFFTSDLYKCSVSDLQSENPLEAAREMAYKIYLYPDPSQETTLKTMLSSRHELATLCGFESYAHRATRASLVENPEFVDEFLTKLSIAIRPYVDEEVEMMKIIKNELNWTSQNVQPWDLTYLTVACRTQKMDKNLLEDLSDHLSLGSVMQGISDLFTSLFGVHLRTEECYRGELWSLDVIKLAVVDSNEEILGHIYCDFFRRGDKTMQDCHFTIRGGKQLSDGSYQNPVVVLHLNLQRDKYGPTLLEFPSVENIFHEMGHAIHSMLARTKYQHITGTRCCTDFAEVPSILMEFFLHDPRVLKNISSHHKTKATLTLSEAEEIIDSRNLFNAMDLNLQTFYAALDQKLHGINDWDNQSTTDVIKEVQEKYYFLSHIPQTAWQHRFGHLVGYGAKYYSYLISRAVASWIWYDNFEDNPFDGNMGQKLRDEILCHGGGKPPKTMVGDYLGKEVTPDNLVNALVKELESRKKSLYNFPIVIL